MAAQTPRGTGLDGLRTGRRAGGTLAVTSPIDAGTRVRATFPLLAHEGRARR